MSSNIVDEEWEAFLNNTTDDTVATKQYNDSNNINNDNLNFPKCDDLYISTTTKVLFLNMPIDIGKIFWDIAIIDYWKPFAGVIKKQMKIVSNTVEEYDNYTKKITIYKLL